MMNFWVAGVCLGVVSGVAVGQSFPIRALGEPVWPVDMGVEALPWEEGLGTMERVGDLNGDGVDDLLVLFASDFNGHPDDRSMWVYWGERGTAGSVSFGTPEWIEGFELGGYISDIVIQDQDGDGLDDLFIVTSKRHSLYVWRSTGTGFVEGYSLDSGSDVPVDRQRVLIADLNQDGDDDYALYSNYDQIGTWTSQGDGSYAYEFLLPEFKGSGELVATDLEVDGDLDLMFVEDGFVSFYRRGLDGWTTSPPIYAFNIKFTNFEAYENYQTCMDANDDGLMDVVAWGENEDGDTGLGFYLAPFGLEFKTVGPPHRPRCLLIDPEPREIEYFDLSGFEGGFWRDYLDPDLHPSMLQSVGDLDGDGTNELSFYPFESIKKGWRISDPMNLNGRRAVYNEFDIHGEGIYEQHSTPDSYLFVYRDAYSDVNGDGVKDRIVPTYAERVDYEGEFDSYEQVGLAVWGVLANPKKRDAVFTEQDAIEARPGMSHVVAVDLDGDGDQEIVFNNDFLRVIDRDADGLYKWDSMTRFSGGLSGFRTVVASMDSDPSLDLLSLRLGSTGAIAPSCFLNPDLGGFGDEIVRNNDVIGEQELEQQLDELNIHFESDDNSFSVGDVDGNGTTDIVIRGQVDILDGYEGESVLVWLNDGAGEFTLGPISPVGDLVGDHIYNMELVDADQDGMLDVVCVEGEIREEGLVLGVYHNDGEGAFGLGQVIPISDGFTDWSFVPYWITVEDVDSDGFDDVVVLLKNNEDAHHAMIVYGGEAGLEGGFDRWHGGNAAELIVVDVDGDGKRDLLSCAYEDSDVELKNSVSIMFQGAARDFGPIVSISDIDLSGVNIADLDGDGGLDLIACSNGTSVPSVVRVYYGIDEVCGADLNLDGALDFFDLSLFVRLLGEQRAIVDLNGDGIWNFGDVSAFLDLYVDGCAGGGL